MFESPPDQPLSVGDLVGRAFRIYRRHLLVFARVLIGPTVAAALGAIGVQWVASLSLSATKSTVPWLTQTVVVIASGLVLILAKWILALRQMAFVRMAMGFARDYGEAYSYIYKRKWLVMGLFVLSSAAVTGVVVAWVLEIVLATYIPRAGLGMLALQITGVGVGTIGLVLCLVAILLVFFLVFAVAACEDRGLFSLVDRAWRLTFADLWRSVGFGLLLYFAFWALSFPLMLPVLGLTMFEVIQRGLISEGIPDAYNPPVYVMALSQIWESLVSMLIWPVVFLAYGLFYYDLRLRQEGLDIARRLAALKEKTLP